MFSLIAFVTLEEVLVYKTWTVVDFKFKYCFLFKDESGLPSSYETAVVITLNVSLVVTKPSKMCNILLSTKHNFCPD